MGVPGFAPPSQQPSAPEQQGLYPGGPSVPLGPVGTQTPNDDRSQGPLVAAIFGGLFALGALVGVAILVLGGDDTPVQPLVATETTGAGDTTAPPEPDDPRIGTTVAGIDLLAGDCIDFDIRVGNISSFDVVGCEEPHLAEISSQIEHPDAGQDYPGLDALNTWAADRCTLFSAEYINAELLDTSLAETPLLPDFADWSDGLYRVSCLITLDDESDLVQSVQGRGANYPRGDEIVVDRLKLGDCFNPVLTDSAFDLATLDPVQLVDCASNHQGLFFGRGELSYGGAEEYPGVDTVDNGAIALCDSSFIRFFGVDADGLNYRYWSPDTAGWRVGDRGVSCALIDDQGLPEEFDFATHQPLVSLPTGSCFVFAPEQNVESLGIDEQVKPVECSSPYNGQLFAYGELPDTGDFPGDDAVDTQVLEICIAEFTSFVGISPTASAAGDFTYWFPTEGGWNETDRRWLCAILADEPFVGGTNEGTSA